MAELRNNIKVQFPTAARMCSWTRLVLGHNEIAGNHLKQKRNKYLSKHLSSKTCIKFPFLHIIRKN